jgi:hypothetical protein
LARLLRRVDRRTEGYAILKECLNRLHEGDDLAVVRGARKLMNELVDAP